MLESIVASGCRHCEVELSHQGTPHWELASRMSQRLERIARAAKRNRPLGLRSERVARSETMIRETVMIAAAPRRLLPSCRLVPGKQMMLVGKITIVKDMRLKKGLVNQERRMGWTYNGRCATTLAAIAIAAMWCTGYACARDRRAEEVLTSCRPDVMRFCERFTGRRDVDAAMFCLRDNFKSLGVECRRAMPTAADRNGGPKRRLNRVPIVLHRE
ncbi:hypothetical protein ACVILL_001260 [Bradyrhizobium sp. USDA 3364]